MRHQILDRNHQLFTCLARKILSQIENDWMEKCFFQNQIYSFIVFGKGLPEKGLPPTRGTRRV